MGTDSLLWAPTLESGETDWQGWETLIWQGTETGHLDVELLKIVPWSSRKVKMKQKTLIRSFWYFRCLWKNGQAGNLLVHILTSVHCTEFDSSTMALLPTSRTGEKNYRKPEDELLCFQVSWQFMGPSTFANSHSIGCERAGKEELLIE